MKKHFANNYNLTKINKFLVRQNIPKTAQEEINNLNNPIFIKEFECIVRCLPTRKIGR